ncbi:MAG: aminotransferase class V-fold PLP-dependent enzyme [Chloroflexi bacterium]|nr:MAG: aminotransferase class V-fold PLP-dependent enzyme [Chloroflexota bacterium]MBL1195920.1 aminotransferase class V-fold PLP-dependent enzyme [Chloroflexota bacterium]NOH13213.1 aminotransferase class V-fold PLP-dependent enzyme [Chloroflexota bacterium]
MKSTESQYNEETLDPNDWDQLRRLGTRMLWDMLEHLETISERPVWQPTSPQVRAAFQSPLPLSESPAESVYEEFLQYILPYTFGNTHPRFWGAVVGTGTPLGMLSDMLAAGINSPPSLGDNAPVWVEKQVIDWCKQAIGFPDEANGILVSGTTLGSLLGLTMARSLKAKFDVREEGLIASAQQMTAYGSDQMHGSLQRAIEIIGIGNKNLRRIPTNSQGKIDIQELRKAIEDDLTKGLQPFCVIGNAGTTNTGAIDPLLEMSEIAGEYDLWLHVDGAFGALATLSPELRPKFEGIHLADSLAFDLHKWFYLPYDIGCLLVRDDSALQHSFSLHMDYLQEGEGWNGGPEHFVDMGLQISRSFRALKAWMAFKTYGVNKIGRLIHQNVQQANYLAELIQDSLELELLAPVNLNVVCFRHTVAEKDNDWLDKFNERIIRQLHASGVAIPTDTVVNGRFAIRCAIVNHRTRREDLELLVNEVIKLGKALLIE